MNQLSAIVWLDWCA